MRTRINKRIYDTDTAEFICDTHSIRGKLFRKYRSNEYFLLSRNGLNIELIDWKTARTFARENAPRNMYLRLFTSQPQDDNRRTNVDLICRDYNKLKVIAGAKNQSIKETLSQIIGAEYRKVDRHFREP